METGFEQRGGDLKPTEAKEVPLTVESKYTEHPETGLHMRCMLNLTTFL